MFWLPAPRLIVACVLWAMLALLAVVWQWVLPMSVVALWCTVVLAMAMVVGMDALRSRHWAQGMVCRRSSLQRLQLEREGTVAFTVQAPQVHCKMLRVGVAWPTALGAQEVVQDFIWPKGAEAMSLTWAVCPVKRGWLLVEEMRVEVSSRWGWGLMRTTVPLHLECRVLANTQFDQRTLASFLMRDGLPGLKLQRFRGLGREFDQLRDYEPGDSQDTIHWKASARRGSWVTKMFQLETTQDIYAILDVASTSLREVPYPGQPQWRMPCLERNVQCATLLGQTAVHNKDKFGLITFDSQVRGFVKAGMGLSHLAYCQQVLAEQHASDLLPDFAEVFTYIATRLRRRAMLFFFIDISDPVLSGKLIEYLPILTRRHLVHVSYCVARPLQPIFGEIIDEGDGHALYEALSDHGLYHQFREFQAQCTRLGASVGMYPSDQFSLRSVQQYLKLKSRQML